MKILKIENLSDRAIPISLEKSQNYSFIPDRLELKKDESREVQVIFVPKVVGDMNEICLLKVGQFSFPFKMLGKGTFVNTKSVKKNSSQKKIEKKPEKDETNQLDIE